MNLEKLENEIDLELPIHKPLMINLLDHPDLEPYTLYQALIRSRPSMETSLAGKHI